MSSQTRSESALIRPFAQIHHADAPFKQVRLLVDGKEHEASVVLAPEELASAKLAVRLPAIDDLRAAVDLTDVPMVDCGLVVLARGHSHRASHQVLPPTYLRTADYADDLEIDRSAADLVLNDKQGFTLTVALVLLHDLTPEPLRPYMAGTWLARRDFRLSPEQEETSFTPKHLTKAVREDFDLPEGTLRFVNVEGALDHDDLADAVDVYLDEEVLNLLLASPSEPGAIQIQTELAVQATEAVAVAIVKELGEGGGAVTPDSLAAYDPPLRFFQNLAKRLDVDLATAVDLTRDPSRLRAHLEAAFEMRTGTIAALKEN